MGCGIVAFQKEKAVRRYGNTKMGYLFMSPFLVLFALFTIVPVLISLALSLTNYNMMETPDIIGITNFKLLILDDKEFLIALKNTLLFAVISGPISFFASFIMAWLISNLKKLRNVFSLAFYAPSITSGVAMSTVWLYFFSSDSYGLINNVLIRMGLISEPIKWTLDPQYILGVVVFISIWMGMGTGFLSFVAGFKQLNRSYFEAAAIDGLRNRWQELWYITLPQMRPQLLIGAVLSISGSFAIGAQPAALTGMPSTDYSTHTLVLHIQDYGNLRREMGYASAVAVVLVAIMVVSWVVINKAINTVAPGEG